MKTGITTIVLAEPSDVPQLWLTVKDTIPVKVRIVYPDGTVEYCCFFDDFVNGCTSRKGLGMNAAFRAIKDIDFVCGAQTVFGGYL